MITGRELAMGALAFAAVELACFPVVWWFWPLKPETPEMMKCPRCGRPVMVEAVARHRMHCAGLLRSSIEFSAKLRRW